MDVTRAIGDAKGEDGAAHGVSLLATMPAAALMVGVFVEVMLALSVTMATQQAARVAARSALVWESEGEDEAALRARRAAALSMVPYASGDPAHRPAEVGEEARRFGKEVADAYRRAGGERYLRSHVVDRSIQAYEGVRVELETLEEGGRRLLRARVRFDHPVTFGPLGRVIGRRAGPGGGFVREVRAEYTRELQEEVPDGLGIGYRPGD